jgi:hypothetical protein
MYVFVYVCIVCMYLHIYVICSYVYICIYIYIYIFMYIYTYVYLYKWPPGGREEVSVFEWILIIATTYGINICAYLHIICVYIHICIYTHMNMYRFLCKYVYLLGGERKLLPLYLNESSCMCTHVWIHVNIHVVCMNTC